jgi:predicted phosphodiesterase
MYFIKNPIAYVLFLLMLNVSVIAQNRNEGNRNNRPPGIFHTEVPARAYDIVLSRPTNNSVTISILASEQLTGSILYGLDRYKLNMESAKAIFKEGNAQSVEINHLLPNRRYYYRFAYNRSNSDQTLSSEINFFQTQRSEKSGFTFIVQADSHLDENTSTQIYTRTLQNMAADSADFLIDLGDTWMTDKYRNGYKESVVQYIAQRYYFGLVCKSSPLFLVLGNHDGESGREIKRDIPDNMTTWATGTRENYYFNPYPNDFYSGNKEKAGNGRNVENYYSWEWGNSLFIVLDPFRYTLDNKDPWQRTLGSEQYNWLRKTLQKSKSEFKFVFIHNLVGGADNNGIARGGIEAARFYEWGGLNSDSTIGFLSHRPTWEKPIHDLLKQYKVTAIFHGHDHVFVKQMMDGIVYQVIPQPGSLRYGNVNSATDYGYKTGTIKNAPGYIRVTVKGNTANVDYLQTSVDAEHKNSEVLNSYLISNPE